MTQINSNGSIGAANTGGQSGAVGKGAANVDQKDADAFAQKMTEENTNADDAVVESKKSELEDFKTLFRRTSFQQFMERSKELVDEAKRNTE